MSKIIVCFLLFFMTAANAETAKIILQFQSRPPYFIQDKLTSKLVDGELYHLINKIMDDAKVPYEYEDMPITRAIYKIKQKNEKICVASGFKTAERESFSVFFLPIFQDKKSVIVIRKGDARFDTLDKAETIIADQKLNLLVKLGFSYGVFIDGLLKKYKNYSSLDNGVQNALSLKYSTVDNNEMLNEIIKQKEDYMFMGGNEASYLMKDEGLSKSLELKSLSDMPEGEKRYFMCSPIIDKETLEKINTSIKKFVKL